MLAVNLTMSQITLTIYLPNILAINIRRGHLQKNDLPKGSENRHRCWFSSRHSTRSLSWWPRHLHLQRSSYPAFRHSKSFGHSIAAAICSICLSDSAVVVSIVYAGVTDHNFRPRSNCCKTPNLNFLDTTYLQTPGSQFPVFPALTRFLPGLRPSCASKKNTTLCNRFTSLF